MTKKEAGLAQGLAYQQDFKEWVHRLRKHHHIKAKDFVSLTPEVNINKLADQLWKARKNKELVMDAFHVAASHYNLDPLQWMSFIYLIVQHNFVFKPSIREGSALQLDSENLHHIKKIYEQVDQMFSRGTDIDMNEGSRLLRVHEKPFYRSSDILMSSDYRSIKLRLSPDATLDEIKNIWPLIEEFQRFFGGKQKYRGKKYDMLRKIVELRKLFPDFTHEDLSKELRKDFINYHQSIGMTYEEAYLEANKKCNKTTNAIKLMLRRAKKMGY